MRATRYITPLREGGSLPAIVEADDLGLYVVKFRGAGQGPLALAAEVIAGEIGRVLGLNVPEIVFIEVDSALGRNEPDQEIRDLLHASVGLNAALDFLPGSTMFDPAARDTVDPLLASQIVWFDAFVTNVDRTARNPNMLLWHRKLYLIDHGASLYFHHDWQSAEKFVESSFAPIREHILLPMAESISSADQSMSQKLDPAFFMRLVSEIPEDWLDAGKRGLYVDLLSRRLKASANFVEEAIHART